MQNQTNCPDDIDILDFLACSITDPTKAADVAFHVAQCQECRNKTFALVDKLNKEVLLSRWADFLAEVERWPMCNLAAAKPKLSADQMLSGLEKLKIIHFCAFGIDENSSDYWHATLNPPPAPTGDTVLRIKVKDGKGSDIDSGELIFCGVSLTVSHGKARIPLVQFQAAISKSQKEGFIALVRNDRKVLGAPDIQKIVTDNFDHQTSV